MLRVRFHDGLEWSSWETKVEPRAVTSMTREKESRRRAVDDGLLALQFVHGLVRAVMKAVTWSG